MRLVSYAELMALPEGTIYQSYEPHNLGNPMIFGGPLKNDAGEIIDYVEASFLPSAMTADYFGDSADADALRGKFGATASDLVILYPSNFGRNGLFEKAGTFLVWDQADWQRLAEWLIDPTKCEAEQNDDPHAMIVVPV